MNYNIFWLRRDLRLQDNHALNKALLSGLPVQCLFIFDDDILDELPENDLRVSLIHDELTKLNEQLNQVGGTLWVKKGKPTPVWQSLIKDQKPDAVYLNHDYEPYALERDKKVKELLSQNDVTFNSFKDHVIFEKDEILNAQGLPFKVYSPFMRAWKAKLRDNPNSLNDFTIKLDIKNIVQQPKTSIIPLKDMGFKKMNLPVITQDLSAVDAKDYDKKRDYPSRAGTSKLGTALRFGTISIRKAVTLAIEQNETFLNELIWREFFTQILWHFPRVIKGPFKKSYSNIPYENNQDDFKRWCEGKTGYPIVDAGMRELNQTGYMHNRVRMITASFLTKHLLIDWQWGEAYFAEKLTDFELASNNGNWQWVAGCGTDAAPYFRIFNPTTQMQKFDNDQIYVKKWIPELNTDRYPQPMVDHKYARERALEAYQVNVR